MVRARASVPAPEDSASCSVMRRVFCQEVGHSCSGIGLILWHPPRCSRVGLSAVRNGESSNPSCYSGWRIASADDTV